MTNEIIRERDEKGKFLSSYKEEYASLVILHLGKGYSIESFAGEIGVNRSTVFEWKAHIESFREAVEVGLAKSQMRWETIGLAGTTGQIKNFNAGSWVFNMKNRFGWRDRHEIKTLSPGEEFGEVSHKKIMDYIEGKKF